MRGQTAAYVTARLGERGLRAHAVELAGHRAGVEVALADGRVACWRGSQATGFEAFVYSRGRLVGGIPAALGSSAWTPDDLVEAIMAAGYGGPEDAHTSGLPTGSLGPVRLMVRQRQRPRTWRLSKM